jgi:TRAP-type C4-dicarboxylate transport system substrate-binding protein
LTKFITGGNEHEKDTGFSLGAHLCLGMAACSPGASSPPGTTAPAETTTPAAGDTGAPSSKPITIRLSGAFAEGSDHYYYFETFCKSVSERSGGSVTVVWGHGPEAIPTDQIAEAMQNGIVELVYTPIAYVVTVAPAWQD